MTFNTINCIQQNNIKQNNAWQNDIRLKLLPNSVEQHKNCDICAVFTQ